MDGVDSISVVYVQNKHEKMGLPFNGAEAFS